MNTTGLWIAKQYWEDSHNFNGYQIKAVDRENTLIPLKIEDTIHSLKNAYHINKFNCMIQENVYTRRFWLMKET